jgi:hypothetical protein
MAARKLPLTKEDDLRQLAVGLRSTVTFSIFPVNTNGNA